MRTQLQCESHFKEVEFRITSSYVYRKSIFQLQLLKKIPEVLALPLCAVAGILRNQYIPGTFELN